HQHARRAAHQRQRRRLDEELPQDGAPRGAERTREIGARTALGATRRAILWQFLVEASTLTLVGGAAGMLVGGGVAFAISRVTPIPANVPLWSIAVALGASALTGVGFGLYPASRAARLDPVEALRYE